MALRVPARAPFHNGMGVSFQWQYHVHAHLAHWRTTAPCKPRQNYMAPSYLNLPGNLLKAGEIPASAEPSQLRQPPERHALSAGVLLPWAPNKGQFDLYPPP